MLEHLSELVSTSRFDEIEKILLDIDILDTDHKLLVAYLAASNLYQDKYKEIYKKIYNETEDILNIIGEDSKVVLKGLKPVN